MPYLHERRIYLNHRHQDNQFYSILRANDDTFIVVFCFDLEKIYLYTETGLLVERIIYKEQAKEWGKPVTISEDARYILFRPSDFSSILHLVRVEISGLVHVKTVDIRERLGRYIQNTLRKSLNKDICCSLLQFFWKNTIAQMTDMSLVRMITSLNDSGDILTQIKPTK